MSNARSTNESLIDRLRRQYPKSNFGYRSTGQIIWNGGVELVQDSELCDHNARYHNTNFMIAVQAAKGFSNDYNTFWYVREVRPGNFEAWAHHSGDAKTVATFYCGMYHWE